MGLDWVKSLQYNHDGAVAMRDDGGGGGGGSGSDLEGFDYYAINMDVKGNNNQRKSTNYNAKATATGSSSNGGSSSVSNGGGGGGSSSSNHATSSPPHKISRLPIRSSTSTTTSTNATNGATTNATTGVSSVDTIGYNVPPRHHPVMSNHTYDWQSPDFGLV
jgi:hypothetical protein